MDLENYKSGEMIPVESSQIAEVGHDPVSQKLRIRFAPRSDGRPGSLYEYSNFTQEDFIAFMTAESVGRYFHAEIKPHVVKYPYKRID